MAPLVKTQSRADVDDEGFYIHNENATFGRESSKRLDISIDVQ